MKLAILRFLLYPVALVYGLIAWFRNYLFDIKVFNSNKFNVPVIVVGNLTTGGTGKTPFVEYLVRLLKEEFSLAVLSRGYKRKTRNFRFVERTSTAQEVGDEPLQMASKFPNIQVAVDRNRVSGIRKLLNQTTPPDCIIMDDGLQHRYVTPGLAVLLTEYSDLYTNDHLLPVGKLREHRNNSKRADLIVVTKSPNVHSPIIERLIREKIRPREHQWLFFSYINYGEPVQMYPEKEINAQEIKNINTIVLFTGIVNPSPLSEHLKTVCTNLILLKFPDHHKYSKKDLKRICQVFDDQFTKNKIIVTTEKDAARLKQDKTSRLLDCYPVYYIPIQLQFHPHMKGFTFDKIIQNYVRNNKKSYQLD